MPLAPACELWVGGRGLGQASPPQLFGDQSDSVAIATLMNVDIPLCAREPRWKTSAAEPQLAGASRPGARCWSIFANLDRRRGAGDEGRDNVEQVNHRCGQILIDNAEDVDMDWLNRARTAEK